MVEAVEATIWLTEVAPQSTSGKDILKYLANANPELLRFALKLATGAGRAAVMAMTTRSSTRVKPKALPTPQSNI